jgi:hypothetical protein
MRYLPLAAFNFSFFLALLLVTLLVGIRGNHPHAAPILTVSITSAQFANTIAHSKQFNRA